MWLCKDCTEAGVVMLRFGGTLYKVCIRSVLCFTLAYDVRENFNWK